MGNLLDCYEFSSLLWDKGAQTFRRSNKVRGYLDLSIREWDSYAFDNPIILTIWQILPGTILWNIWKERNDRIFKGNKMELAKVWQKIIVNVQEMIRSKKWDEMARKLSASDRHIATGWGLTMADLLGLNLKNKICHPFSPSLWMPPSQRAFKVNFDRASRGNLGLTGFGGICRNDQGEILKVFFGYLGHDTNKSVELEGIIQGLTLVTQEGWLLAILEGDSIVIIEMAKKFTCGKAPGKVSFSWRLRLRLDVLQSLLSRTSVVSFSHVHRDANKVADLLVNQGIESDRPFLLGSLEDFWQDRWVDRCQDLVLTDLHLVEPMIDGDMGPQEHGRLHEDRTQRTSSRRGGSIHD